MRAPIVTFVEIGSGAPDTIGTIVGRCGGEVPIADLCRHPR